MKSQDMLGKSGRLLVIKDEVCRWWREYFKKLIVLEDSRSEECKLGMGGGVDEDILKVVVKRTLIHLDVKTG